MQIKNSKVILILVFLILIAGIAGGILYFEKKNIEKPAEKGKSLEISVDWKGQLPAIEKIIKKELPGSVAVENRGAEIFKEGDVTGDGIPEVLVYTGSGGAYTDELALFMMENGEPVLAKFKYENGDIGPLTFLTGSSVRHGEAADMAPNDHAVYSASWSLDDNGELESCDAEVYLWNKDTQIFEYNSTLSDGSKQTLCQK